MTGWLLIMIICTILLYLAGAMSPLLGAGLVVGCGVSILTIGWHRHQINGHLDSRCQALHAAACLQVRHLGGLPIPLQADGGLYLLGDAVRVETDHYDWQIPLHQVVQVMPMTGDQMKNLPDQQLCTLMGAGSSRLLSTVRDQIRRGIRSVHYSELLLMTVQENPADNSDIYMIILAVPRQHRNLMRLLSQPTLQRVLTFHMLSAECNENG
jgi:hypothetical protein